MSGPWIMVVDPDGDCNAELCSVLAGQGFQCRKCRTVGEAWDALDASIDLVLVASRLDDGSGIDFTRKVRHGHGRADVPVIMLTAVTGMAGHLDAVQAGVNDFICRPVDPTELNVRILALLKLKQAQDVAKLRDLQLAEQVARQAARLEAENARLEHIARTDPLTGLANHGSIVTTLLAESRKCLEEGLTACVLFLDLDHFKALNDSFGHICGDSVLREFGAVLKHHLRNDGLCGRWGGEEFVVVLPSADVEIGLTVAERLRQAVSRYRFEAAPEALVTCSIGVACIPEDGADLGTVVEAADRAMYVAKSLGRNQVRTTKDADASLALLCETKGSREEQALAGVIEALVTMVGTRDVYESDHTKSVEALALRIAADMGLGKREAHVIGMAARLHDIGKVAIPDAILQKAGPLNEQEWETVRAHPVVGAQIVGRIPALSFVAPVIEALHERWDGKGYPNLLKGEDIPLPSRVIAVADAFCAMTADRPHRLGVTVWQAVDEIRACSGTQFAPDVVESFLRVLDAEAGDQVA
ncbi:MAG: diguanylate cyclase [Armatimonadetes bacterium]|nr:diguanylate cyclase [Armatimonadota bacterium]